jgi:hypothetical protein
MCLHCSAAADGLFVLNRRLLQLGRLAILRRRKQLGIVALFVGGLPFRKSGAPTKINGLAASRFEGKPSYVQHCRCLPIAKVRHDGGEVGSRDDVEQFLFLERKPWPHFPQAVDRIDVGDDRVMAGAFESLVVEEPLAPLRIIGCAARGID